MSKDFILKRVVKREDMLPSEIPVTLDGVVLQRFNENRVKGTMELKNIGEEIEAIVTYGIVTINNGGKYTGRRRMLGGEKPRNLKVGSNVYLGPAGIYEIQETSSI